MADLQKEIDALDRVLFRLASVDDERLLTVLDALLPQLLELFPATTALPLEFQLKDKVGASSPFSPPTVSHCG
jgi:hypothetical protein